MAKHCLSAKGKEKQLEKELPWGMIPPAERPLYLEAEDKQWQEHVSFGAVKPLSIEDSETVEATVHPSRILRARYAYKDKNHSKRKADPTVACKPKARLCIAGQHDPDLGVKDMAVDAPTACRHSILLAIQLALCRGWHITVGDIRAAFLNGVPAPRQLYFRQPRGGIRGLRPKQLIEDVKGVFGLSTSPKLWWMKLSQDLCSISIQYKGRAISVEHNPIDPCVFMLIDGEKQETLGLLLTHVDDLMLLAEKDLSVLMRKELDARFPVDEWQEGEFEYVGCEYKVSNQEIFVSQKGYTESRVTKVDVKRGEVGREEIEENRTSIGSLSWLSKQTRPDLQFYVSQAQKKQNDPTLEDLKFTNKAVSLATKHGGEGVHLRKIDEDKLIFLAYHDAAWGNADLEDSFDPTWTGTHQVASQIGSLILIADRGCLGSPGGKFSLIDWKSKGCRRVCRSTFAGETMACCEAMESGTFLRALFLSFVHGKIIPEEACGEFVDLHMVTDCKSLFDHIHREGVPKAPTEKRLAIDLASVRQTLVREAAHQWRKLHGPDATMAPERPCRPPLHWLPTESQLADILTKAMSAEEWWKSLREGFLCLPLKGPATPA